MKTQHKLLVTCFISVVASILFIHSLGAAHLFDWDEINFAESAREMLVSNDFTSVQINFEPFWEKPPLFIWMQAFSMSIFGVNEWAARFPNAICGILTLVIIWNIGMHWHGQKLAKWWCFLYAASFLPHLYFKSGIIDPWFNLFIFCSIYAFLERGVSNNKKYDYMGWGGIMLGIAVLTKGPVAILLVGITFLIFLIIQKKLIHYSIIDFLIALVVTTFVAITWFSWEIYNHGWLWITEFLKYQFRLATTKDAGHGGFLFYHIVVLMVGCFPASAFAMNLNFIRQESKKERIMRIFMLCMLGVIIIVFSVVKTKIIHYSSLAYFPITYLGAISIKNWLKEESIPRLNRLLVISLGFGWAVIMLALPLLGKKIEVVKYFAKNDINVIGNLQADVDWPLFLFLPSILLFSTCIYFITQTKNNRINTRAVNTLLITSLFCIQFIITFFIPRIEKYTQNATITFFENLAGKNVYVGTLFYKSYAPYFYAKISPENAIKNPLDLIKTGSTKTYYFVSKQNSKEKISREFGDKLKIIRELNGFIFYRGEASKIK